MSIPKPKPHERLHLEDQVCPVCNERTVVLRVWLQSMAGSYVLRHGAVEHLEDCWPFK